MSQPVYVDDDSRIDESPVVVENDSDVSESRLKILQSLAIAALLPGTSLTEAAALCGVCRTTIWRWTKQPHFQEALNTAREEAFTKANANLKYISQEAVYVLGRNLRNGHPATEIRAATAVLNQVYKSTSLLQQERRLLTLEKALKELNGNAAPNSTVEEIGLQTEDANTPMESHIPLLEV